MTGTAQERSERLPHLSLRAFRSRKGRYAKRSKDPGYLWFGSWCDGYGEGDDTRTAGGRRKKKRRLNGALWQMADALRGSMDAAEYKHVVLGLIFLKYISDAFEERHVLLESEREQGADPEDPDEYRAENIFWVPSEARWTHLKAQAKQPTVGQLVDNAMTGIERDNPARPYCTTLVPHRYGTHPMRWLNRVLTTYVLCTIL